VQRFVGDEMERIASAKHGSLGVAFVLSLILSLWSANGAVKALFFGLNVAYDEQERRGLLHLNLISLVFTLGVIVFAVAAVTALVASPSLFAALDLEREGALLAPLRWPALLVMLTLGLSIIYRYGPCRRRPQWSWISIGGAAAAVLWLAASLLFSWYLGNFAHYDRTYGSLGAVIGFMVWLWYTIIIVLLGAELNAELEHQTAIDTTSGPARPMGARGARIADTLGRRA
jgi:membrane protein